LTGPNPARYGRKVVLRGAIVPGECNLAVELAGPRGKIATTRTRADGTYLVRARIRAPGSYTAAIEWAAAVPLALRVVPKLVTGFAGSSARGSAYYFTAHLVPAAAGALALKVARGQDVILDRTFGGRVRIKLDTKRLTTYRITTQVVPSEYAGTVRSLRASVVLPRLVLGARNTRHPAPKFARPAAHIEVNKALQVLYVVRGSRVALIVPISTAGIAGAFAPVGRFAVYRKVGGFDPSPLGTLYDPLYFTGGYAIHGNPSVPPYPASHGCVRVPMWVAPQLYKTIPYGETVYVY
jgi:lipoprotein-anchoring transpeptidase ErfK/SrfK